MPATLANGLHHEGPLHMTAPNGHASSMATSSSLKLPRSNSVSQKHSYPLVDRQSLYVRETQSSGRGVFAAVPLASGSLIEVSHVLLFPPDEYQHHGRHTQLDNYTYVWTKSSQGSTMALALGLGSLFNHSATSPNVSYSLDREEGTISYTLARDVSPGEELLICYGTGKMWWEDEEDSSIEQVDDHTTELFLLGQLGLDLDERETREQRRKEERHRQIALFDADTANSSRSPSVHRDMGEPEPVALPPAVGPEHAPMWRVTAALDPNTTPLTLMHVWAVRIDPRKSENFMRFSRSIARRLQAAEWGESSLRARNQPNDGYEEDDDEDDSDDEDESMKHLRLFQRINEGRGLIGLVCRVQDEPSYEKVVALLKTADLVVDGTEPQPYQVRVPQYPAPSRERLPEWKAYWPVSVKWGKANNTLLQSSLSGAPQGSTGSSAPGVVDRAADARLWTEHALGWAKTNLRKALKQAHEAQKRGKLPIGVHVTSTYPDGDSMASGVAEGQASIEIDAHDTRRSERNPIKHAVTNAIRDVAKERSERDWERLLILSTKVAHLHRDPNVDPNAHRVALQRAEALAAERGGDLPSPLNSGAPVASTSSSPTSTGTSSTNGRSANAQDYLLNNLTLFTTHEPCVSCCMALVHSRVRAICFINPSPGAGGCCGSGLDDSLQCAACHDGGPYAVQEQAGLNHRFDVWRWVGNDADLLEKEDGIEPADAHSFVRLDILGLDV